jgi:hypothetical protein
MKYLKQYESFDLSSLDFDRILLYSYFFDSGDTRGDSDLSRRKVEKFDKMGAIDHTLMNFAKITDNVIKIAMDECYEQIVNRNPEKNFSKKLEDSSKDRIINLWRDNLFNPSDYMIAIYSMKKYCEFLLKYGV